MADSEIFYSAKHWAAKAEKSKQDTDAAGEQILKEAEQAVEEARQHAENAKGVKVVYWEE